MSDQRIGVGGEQLLAISDPVTIGVSIKRVGTVDIALIPVRHMVSIGVRVGRIESWCPGSSSSGALSAS